MNTLHIIRTELIQRGYPISQIHLIDVVLAERIDGLEGELQLLRQELVALKQAFYQLKTKGSDE